MIAILGCNGLVGRAFQRILSNTNVEFKAFDRTFDITDESSISRILDVCNPTLYINCAALVDANKAESDHSYAKLVNEDGVQNILNLAKRNYAKILHFSSDYVFSGDSDTPYIESDLPSPVNQYGVSKAAGEKVLYGSDSWVVRTSWVFGPNGRNFVSIISDKLRNELEINVVDDQIGKPTFTDDLVEACLRLTGTLGGNPGEYGTYHYSNAGTTTWYDFAVLIKHTLLEKGVKLKNDRIIPVSSSSFSTLVKRPSYSVMDCSKIESVLGSPIRHHSLPLKKFIDENIQ